LIHIVITPAALGQLNYSATTHRRIVLGQLATGGEVASLQSDPKNCGLEISGSSARRTSWQRAFACEDLPGSIFRTF
jgi:hypothetical protein